MSTPTTLAELPNYLNHLANHARQRSENNRGMLARARAEGAYLAYGKAADWVRMLVNHADACSHPHTRTHDETKS